MGHVFILSVSQYTELQWQAHRLMHVHTHTHTQSLLHTFTNTHGNRNTHSHMWMEVIRVEQSWKIKAGRKCWKHEFGKWPHKHPVPSLPRSLSLSLCHCLTMISVCFSFFLLWDVNEGHQKTLPPSFLVSLCLSLSLSHCQSCLAAYSLHLVLIWASFPPTAIQPKTISSFNFQGKLLNGFWTKQAFFFSPSFFPRPLFVQRLIWGQQSALCCLVCNNELPGNKAGGGEINISMLK